MPAKKDYLKDTIRHIDITKTNVVPIVDAMKHMAFTARDLHRAADIYDKMLKDTECGVILCLAGSLISAGLKKVFVDMIRNNMVDAVVSTGANIVDQDFFEGLGYKHYLAADEFKSGTRDGELRELMIDRIYDTFIDEDLLEARADERTGQAKDDAAVGIAGHPVGDVGGPRQVAGRERHVAHPIDDGHEVELRDVDVFDERFQEVAFLRHGAGVSGVAAENEESHPDSLRRGHRR